MSVIQTAKDHPAKTIFGMAGSIIAIVSALFALDARYAHAADVEKSQVETQQIIKETARILRKQALEDKIFEYDIRKEEAELTGKKMSPIEVAVQKRYKRQLEELNQGKDLQ